MNGTPWVAMEQHLVHRNDERSVLLEAYRQPDGHDVEFTLKRPVGGPYSIYGGAADPLLVAEYLRQTTIAYGHVAWGVPVGWAFIMGRMELRSDRSLPRGALTAAVRAVDPKLSGGALRTMTSDVSFFADGAEFARGRGALKVVSKAVYSRLRRDGLNTMPARATRPTSASSLSLDVVRDAENEWDIRFDERDPFFFDHHVDHVPGMLLFDAVRRACVLAAGAPRSDLRAFDGTYTRFAELHEPLRVRVTRTDIVKSRPRRHFEAEVCGEDGAAILTAKAEVE
jgi:hypothetical protein